MPTVCIVLFLMQLQLSELYNIFTQALCIVFPQVRLKEISNARDERDACLSPINTAVSTLGSALYAYERKTCRFLSCLSLTWVIQGETKYINV